MPFFKELRRRKVLRFSGIYVVSAWLVFQVADVFFPAWGIPEAALRYLLFAAVACFPVAVVFSWNYDLTAGGISRTQPAEPGETPDLGLKRFDYLLLSGLVVVTCAILYDSFGRVIELAGEAPLAQEVKEKPLNSIAVLPFDNLDPDPDTGYFSNGVSEEILHRLSATKALKVIGRTSSFAFADADMELGRISEILGVRYLLGGSVRRVGDQVRLTARLVDESGFQVWSESFDGELRDIFAFQDSIAAQVAGEITREVIVPESPKSARTTKNVEAYQQYLIGREYFHSRVFGWQNKAAEAYRRSIEADPGFALPYAGLAIAIKMGADIEDEETVWDQVNDLIDQAMALHPDLPEAWMARGLTHLGEPGWDLDDDIQQLERAIELDPSLSTAYNFLSVALIWSGRRDESGAILEKGLEIDPLSPIMLLNYANTFMRKGDFSGWKRQVMKLMDLPQPPWRAYQALSYGHLEFGQLTEALHWKKQQILHEGRQSEFSLVELAQIYELLGMQLAADYWLDRIRQEEGDERLDDYLELWLAMIRGNPAVGELLLDSSSGQGFADPGSPGAELAAKIMITGGNFVEGIALLEGMVSLSEPLEGEQDGDWEILQRLHWLAYAYQQSGRNMEAGEVLAYASKMLELFKDGEYFRDHPRTLMYSSLEQVIAGNLGAAATALHAAVDMGWREYHLERHSPIWRGAWSSKEFAPVVEDILLDLERMRQEVGSTEAERGTSASLTEHIICPSAEAEFHHQACRAAH